MNEIEIKQEPIDFDDILCNSELQQQQQIEREEIKDINLNDIKAEFEEEQFSCNSDFNNFRIVNEEADIITLEPTNEKSEDELKFIQLFDIFGKNKKRKNSYTNINTAQQKSKQLKLKEHNAGNSTQLQCTYKCGQSFSTKRECAEHEQDEAKNFCSSKNVVIKSELEEEIQNDCKKSTDISSDITIKEEPQDNEEFIIPDTSSKNTSTHDNKSPIPKIKIPASLFNSLKKASSTNILPNIDAIPCMQTFLTTQTQQQSLISHKIPATIAAAKIQNNILQPIKFSNNAFILKTPNNIKILKLPPNTRIVKLDPNQSLNDRNKATPTSVLQIKNESSTPTFIVAATQPTNSEQQLKDRIIAAQKKTKSIHFVSKPALNFIENLPESRKAINDLLQQVKQAETVSSQTAAEKKPSKMVVYPNARTSVVSNAHKASNPAIEKLETTEIKTEITSETTFPGEECSDSNSSSGSLINASNENIITTVHIPIKGNDSVLAKARRANPNNRCFWLCPRCPRQYAQRNTIRLHLENHHAMSDDEVDCLILEVKIMRIGGDCSKAEISFTSETTNDLMPNEDPETTSMATTDIKMSALNIKNRDNGKYQCDKCGRKCSSKVTLIDHIAANCSREPQYKCSQCPKKFYSVSTLNCHVTIHTGELPHKCDYCDKRFRTRGQVTVHHRTHTGERPFKCQVCSQCFTHRETLIAHLSRHIGMKRYKCYACNKLFSCISGLRTHRETRPDTCGKVKFNPRALGPRVRVVKGNVIFEPQPEVNPYLRSEEPPEIISE